MSFFPIIRKDCCIFASLGLMAHLIGTALAQERCRHNLVGSLGSHQITIWHESWRKQVV